MTWSTSHHVDKGSLENYKRRRSLLALVFLRRKLCLRSAGRVFCVIHGSSEESSILKGHDWHWKLPDRRSSWSIWSTNSSPWDTRTYTTSLKITHLKSVAVVVIKPIWSKICDIASSILLNAPNTINGIAWLVTILQISWKDMWLKERDQSICPPRNIKNTIEKDRCQVCIHPIPELPLR